MIHPDSLEQSSGSKGRKIELVRERENKMPIVHCKKASYDVYIGRPSKWGNPYSHLAHANAIKVATREIAIELYQQKLMKDIKEKKVTLKELAELDGKTLGCWCHPLPCHGSILLKAAAWAKQQLDR